jgi:hypothetical protein
VPCRDARYWEQPLPSERAKAETGEIAASGDEDQRRARAVQGPARVTQETSDEDAGAQREKSERDYTDEPPTVRTTADGVPQRRQPAHAAPGTDCDRFDHGEPRR